MTRDQKLLASRLRVFSEPTRLKIMTALAEQPLSVGELASRFPMSRPAVSQHLGALAAAGLVTSTPKGNRRIYSVNPTALAGLGEFLLALVPAMTELMPAVVAVLENPATPAAVARTLEARADCDDPRCTRLGGRCVGFHCAHCGEPCSSQGHHRCPQPHGSAVPHGSAPTETRTA